MQTETSTVNNGLHSRAHLITFYYKYQAHSKHLNYIQIKEIFQDDFQVLSV